MAARNHLGSVVTPLLILLMFSLIAVPSAAQNCPACGNDNTTHTAQWIAGGYNDVRPEITDSGNSAWVMRKLVNEVTVLFSVTNKGKFIDGLALQDIEVEDDKKAPSAILDFRSEKDLPLRLALLIDTSDSITERFEFEQQAATRFLQQVIRRGMDQAFVMGFNGRTNVTQEFTDDPELLAKGVQRLKAGGNTALYDAVYSACERLARTTETGTVARVVVLLTDGDDTASRRTYANAVDAANRAGVTIFGVSTNKIDQAVPGDVRLKAFGEETGGRTIFPGEANDLPRAFSKVEKEIRSRYAVSYRPAAFEPNGRYRKIRIVARHLGKKLHVRARRGYYARLEPGFP
jgi:Ca-activated chloride channel homolog